ncbi:hypothetical protein BC831DRAFT_462968 [Entophlyctis helioformis]|nr:hypothetical protein BC831DRAFT_462968 [Entophlyctis helioformis]
MTAEEDAIHQQALGLIRYAEQATLKLTISSIETLALFVCIPLYIIHRHQPVIKFRTWSITVFATACLIGSHWLDAIMGIDNAVPYERLQSVLFARSILNAFTISFPHAVFLRHYFLLQLPIIQAELLDPSTITDAVRYTTVRRKLKRAKFLASWKAAWLMYLPHAILLGFVFGGMVRRMNIDLFIVGKAATFTIIRASIYIFEVASSTIILVFLLPKGSPEDNFHIKSQYYAMSTCTVLFLVMSAIVTGLFPTNTTARSIDGVWGSITMGCTVLLSLCVGPALVLSGVTYKVGISNNGSGSSQSGSFDGVAKKEGDMTFNQQLSASVLSADSINAASTPMSPTSPGVTLLGGKSALTSVSSAITPPMPKSHNTAAAGIASTGAPPGSSGAGTGGSSGGSTCPITGPKPLTIKRILKDPAKRDVFAKYLAREFAMESLLFVEAVKRYRELFNGQIGNDAEIRSTAKSILSEFIEPNADNEVKLPKRITDKMTIVCESQIEMSDTVPRDTAKHVFDAAMEYVLQMMSANHLKKFEASTCFRAFKAAQARAGGGAS